MFEETTLQPSSSMQRWRQLWHVTTLDMSDMKRLLALFAETLCSTCEAEACAITYRLSVDDVVDAHYGVVPGEMQRLMTAAESRIAAQPLLQEGARGALLTLPLLVGGERTGAVHLMARESSAPLEDLKIVVAMLANSLARQVSTEQSRRLAEESERKYRSVVDHVQEVVFQTDPKGRWTFLNPAWTEITGFGREESLGASFADYVYPDDRQRTIGLLQPIIERDKSYTRQEIRYLTKDGKLRWMDASLRPMLNADGAVVGISGILHDVTDRKEAEAENVELTEALRIERDRLLRREVDVRTQIGRDLHDGPVQQVAVADLTVQYVRRVAERAPERLGEALDDLEDQLKRATRDLRTVLYELRPLGIAEQGLVSVLQQYVARVRDPNGMQLHLEALPDLPRLAPDHESAVFIIVQEALNNVRKHAKARDVWINVSSDGAVLRAEVADNGQGFEVEAVQASYIQRGSFGLLNMVERAQLIGGTCAISSRRGKGTTIRIEVPLTTGDVPPAPKG